MSRFMTIAGDAFQFQSSLELANFFPSSVIDNMASIATSLWDSIFTPGPTPILIKAMNLSFFALFALLIPLIFVTKNIHVFFLTILAIGLWIGMQWCSRKISQSNSRFLIELEKAKTEQQSSTLKEE
jgi:hypothetical protein